LLKVSAQISDMPLEKSFQPPGVTAVSVFLGIAPGWVFLYNRFAHTRTMKSNCGWVVVEVYSLFPTPRKVRVS